MPNDVVGFICELVPRVACNAFEDAIRPLDAALEIRSGEKQLVRRKLARFVNQLDERMSPFRESFGAG